MAENCPTKTFHLVSELFMLESDLERGKDWADEVSVNASLAKSTTHKLMEEGCITKEEHREIEDKLERIGFLSTMKRVKEAEREYEPLFEKVEEAIPDLREKVRKGVKEWMEE